MKKETLDFIKELSLKDPKTLSQKALKVSEESGELASVTLPFDNASGTTHRFVEKERVLEESVDVILSAISMAYELGYSHEDINEMMWNKAQKWHGIQHKEEKVDYPIPYEIHITVETDFIWNRDKTDKLNFEVNDFKKSCEEIGVKPIVIDLENNGESVMKDVMTSSNHYGNNASAYEECLKITKHLESHGFVVTRKKIETVPWHPGAPSKKGDTMPEDCYFEAHIGCIISKEDKEELRSIADFNNAHLSRNFFKKVENGKFVNMVTLRSYDGIYEEFEFRLENLKRNLKDCKIDFDKVITEFSIYDTNGSHDATWLTGKKEEVCESE